MRFDLAKIQKAAKQGNVRYKGRKVSKDVANLGHTLDDVIACIVSLTLSDFQKTKEYSESKAFDVYIKDFVRVDQPSDKIYMKLRLLEGDAIEIVEVGSFHL